jgi:hypothetical protein
LVDEAETAENEIITNGKNRFCGIRVLTHVD